MEGSSVSKNNKLAGWIDEFVNTFAKTAEKETEKTAEININDLPKVVWNDETFYVFFDQEGAAIINGFGNTVTTIPNAKTLDEVNEKLNAKQIVSENVNNSLEINAEIEKEINKALAYTITADESGDAQAQDYVNNDPNANANQSQQPAPEQPSDQSQTQDQTQTQTQASFGQLMCGESLKAVDYTEKTAEMINVKFAEFETRIAEMLNSKLADVVEQFYSRVNPGDVYDQGNEIQQQEIAKFNQEAEETVNQVAQENGIDRTTPEGKYKIDNVEVEINVEPTTKTVEPTEEVSLENSDEKEVELPEEEVEVFKTGSCPFCGEKLTRTGNNGNFVDIKCDGCDVKYKVNADNEKIYLK